MKILGFRSLLALLTLSSLFTGGVTLAFGGDDDRAFVNYFSDVTRYGVWGYNSQILIDTVTDTDLNRDYKLTRTGILPQRYFELSLYHSLQPIESTGAAKQNVSSDDCDSEIRAEGYEKLSALFDALAQDGRVQPLDAQIRTKLGGIWSETSQSPNRDIPAFLVFGGYQCVDQKLVLEQGLRPFNTSSLIAHEMDHYYRDRTWNPEGLSIRSAVFIDELLSYVTGGLLQLDAKYHASRLSTGQSVSTKIEPWLHPYSAGYKLQQMFKKRGGRFQPTSDLTMYNRSSQGHLKNLYLKNHASLCGTMGFILDDLGHGTSDKNLRELAKAIAIGNFGENEAAQHLENLKGKVSWEGTPTLFHWIYSSEKFRDLGFQTHLHQLTEKSAQPSPLCSRFTAGAASGLLRGYLGAGSSADNSGRPGGEGVKVDGITLPGGEGVKVEKNLIRACTSTAF